jgi:hypothetical protein
MKMALPMRKSESGPTGFVWVRGLLVRPRLVFSVAFGIVVALTMPDTLGLHPLTRIILGWNAGAWVYLVLALLLMFRSTHESMRSRAIAEDDGRTLVLTLVVLAAIVGVGWLWRQYGDAVGWAGDNLLEPARIDVHGVAPWVRADIKAEALKAASLDRGLPLTDPDLANRLARVGDVKRASK